MSDSPPKYAPQFSAATEMILKRINSGNTGSLSSIDITSTPPSYEDTRRSVLMGIINMEIPSTAVGENRGRSGKATVGRAITLKTAGTPPVGSSASGGKGKGIANPRIKIGTKRKRT
jgi:hypothetical protein